MDKRIQIGLKLPRDLIERIDKAKAALPVEPQRTAVIEAAIEDWLRRFEKTHKQALGT
jgi:metal-responsive CopG/Arc/MetJ family transcriptional regulator